MCIVLVCYTCNPVVRAPLSQKASYIEAKVYNIYFANVFLIWIDWPPAFQPINRLSTQTFFHVFALEFEPLLYSYHCLSGRSLQEVNSFLFPRLDYSVPPLLPLPLIVTLHIAWGRFHVFGVHSFNFKNGSLPLAALQLKYLDLSVTLTS